MACVRVRRGRASMEDRGQAILRLRLQNQPTSCRETELSASAPCGQPGDCSTRRTVLCFFLCKIKNRPVETKVCIYPFSMKKITLNLASGKSDCQLSFDQCPKVRPKSLFMMSNCAQHSRLRYIIYNYSQSKQENWKKLFNIYEK